MTELRVRGIIAYIGVPTADYRIIDELWTELGAPISIVDVALAAQAGIIEAVGIRPNGIVEARGLIYPVYLERLAETDNPTSFAAGTFHPCAIDVASVSTMGMEPGDGPRFVHMAGRLQAVTIGIRGGSVWPGVGLEVAP